MAYVAIPAATGGGGGGGGTSAAPVSGDGSGGSPFTIADGAIGLPKLATQADQTALLNVSGGAASPIAGTATQMRTMLGVQSSNAVAITGGTITAVAITASTLNMGSNSVVGDTLTTTNLTLRPNAADTTTGRAVLLGLGVQLPAGTAAAPSINFGTVGTGIYGPNSISLGLATGGVTRWSIDATSMVCASTSATAGFYIGAAVSLTADGAGGVNLSTGSTARIKISSGGNIGFFGVAAVAQQTVGANVNNVAASGTTGQFDDFTNGTVYATDYANLHATVYQLTRSVAQHTVALRNVGLGA